jgi:V8-like Glu-specific endopeptidase
MAAARPADRPVAGQGHARLGTAARVGEKPILIAGSEPGDLSPEARGSAPATYDYPFPYTRYAVENPLYTLFPYTTIGKIFFRRGGTDFVCSGASVAGGPRQVVFTAGHCLNNGNGLYSKLVVFVPAFRSGQRPFGTFPAKELWVLTPWDEDGDETYDIGAFDVGKNGAGQKLGPAVGKLGFGANLARELHWNVFGWPAELPFTGATLQVCQASHAGDDLSVPGLGEAPIAIGCDLTGGSSGGPWIYRFKRGSYLNSVMSYGYDAEPEGSYGPYFDSNANLLRCAAATGNGSATTC